MKEKIGKIIYVAIWTIVMCYASFNIVFKKGFEFILNCEKTDDLLTRYIFPLFVAVGLYIIDDIYNALLLFKQDRPFHSIVILVSLLGLFVGFLFSVYAGALWLRVLMFILVWISLGFLKYYETPSLCLNQNSCDEGYEVSES